MTYTLAHIWSGVRSRLRDPNAAEPAAITVEANNALNELRGRIKLSREDWLDTTARTDILSGKDTYDYPDQVDTLKMIERIDLAGGGIPYPAQRSSYHDRASRDEAQILRPLIADGVTVLTDRRIQIAPAPTADFAGGLRWTFLPRITPLVYAIDSPVGVPEQFFEWLIVGTIDRMRQFRGIALSDPQSYEQFRQEQTARLTKELRPKELMTPPHIIDEDEFYSPVY